MRTKRNQYTLRMGNDLILRPKCNPVVDFSKLDDILSSMKDIVSKYGAAGISSSQVGYDGQIVIVDINDRQKVFINPKILSAGEYVWSREECLSFPGKSHLVRRNYSIDLLYQNELGREMKEKFCGLNSIVLQHQIELLNGRTMYSPYKIKFLKWSPK